jgi:hypothetical protein
VYRQIVFLNIRQHGTNVHNCRDWCDLRVEQNDAWRLLGSAVTALVFTTSGSSSTSAVYQKIYRRTVTTNGLSEILLDLIDGISTNIETNGTSEADVQNILLVFHRTGETAGLSDAQVNDLVHSISDQQAAGNSDTSVTYTLFQNNPFTINSISVASANAVLLRFAAPTVNSISEATATGTKYQFTTGQLDGLSETIAQLYRVRFAASLETSALSETNAVLYRICFSAGASDSTSSTFTTTTKIRWSDTIFASGTSDVSATPVPVQLVTIGTIGSSDITTSFQKYRVVSASTAGASGSDVAITYVRRITLFSFGTSRTFFSPGGIEPNENTMPQQISLSFEIRV